MEIDMKHPNKKTRPFPFHKAPAALLLCVSLFLCSMASGLQAQAAPVDLNEEAKMRREIPIESNERENWPAGPTVSAQSAILMEAETGTILYEKNIHERLYPASITKILTGLIAMEQCSLDEKVSFSQKAVDSIDWRTDANLNIKPGEQITVEQALYGLLTGSANEVANALGEHISGSTEEFAKLMNQRARELGCVDSHFVTTNGIHDEEHYTSAHDMALIAQAFFSNDLLCKISSTPSYTIPPSPTVSRELYVKSKNQLFAGRDYAYEYLVGSKTGYTSQARQTLVSCAQKDGMKLICVVMKEEAPSQYKDTIDLFNYGFSNFHMVNVAEEDTQYTVDSNSFFDSDSDAFGSSSPILSIDPAGVIVLPNTAGYGDADSSLSYEELEGENTLARISYTYNGIPVGSAYVQLAPPSGSQVSGQTGHDGDSNSEIPASTSPSIYVNVIHVLGGLAGLALILAFLIWLVTLLRNYSFSSERKKRFRWRKRRESSRIDLERYIRKDHDL